MKKRRFLIVSLLLIAALTLGIGYAALSSTLQVNGSIENDPANVNVVFSSSTLTVTSPTPERETLIEAASDAGVAGTAVISIQAAGLKEVGDTITFNLTIENKGNLSVNVEELALEGTFDSEFYELTIDSWDDGVELGPADSSTKNAEATVTVRVIKLTDTQQIQNFTLKAIADPKNDGN